MGGRRDVDTSRFRRAIWNYIQCLLGIRHDDYDYGEINQLLERSLKTFIKSACCYPERVTKKDYDRVLREFKHSEKVSLTAKLSKTFVDMARQKSLNNVILQHTKKYNLFLFTGTRKSYGFRSTYAG